MLEFRVLYHLTNTSPLRTLKGSNCLLEGFSTVKKPSTNDGELHECWTLGSSWEPTVGWGLA